jgi:hypothetical protein
MLQPHSFLWHYLWLGPHVLEAALAALLWRRGIHKQFPFFVAYLVFDAIEQYTLWTMDVLPLSWVSAQAWWSAFCTGAVIEGLLKFAFVLELFLRLVRSRPTVAKLGKRLFGCAGATLIALAAWAAAHAPIADNFRLGSYGHILEQTIFIVECGLLLFIFLFAAYHHLTWNRWALGIALGASISGSAHLGSWAIMANSGPLQWGYLLDFLNMATYHVCVLIWFYYLLLPFRPSAATVPTTSETKTDIPDSGKIRMFGPRVVLPKS